VLRKRRSRSDLLEPRFWGASELTIQELIGSINTSAFIETLDPKLPPIPTRGAPTRSSQLR